MSKTYFVYILTNKTKTVLYTGVTNDLDRRLMEHRAGTVKGFTSKYRVTDLVYFEAIEDINSAIEREKQIKAGSREDKVNLINQMNPEWKDLAQES
jgi:putative endonuclease